MLKYFIDCEFIEDGKTIDLISIGIVCEDGRELYMGNRNCDFSKASQWVQDNVLVPIGFDFSNPNIPMRPIDPYFWTTKENIAKSVFKFCNPDEHGKPEFWAYYAAYDHVALCQLFGTMMDLPKGFPMYCCDLQQESIRLGIDLSTKVPQTNEHNALFDARWTKKAYEYLFCPYSSSTEPFSVENSKEKDYSITVTRISYRESVFKVRAGSLTKATELALIEAYDTNFLDVSEHHVEYTTSEN